MWSSRRRSYIGMTAHWLSDDLNRRSACLAIRRVTGSHTYDVIANAINDVHTEFKIAKKVIITITDNGSNFLKAFKVFDSNTLEESPDPENVTELIFTEEEDETFLYIDIGEIILSHEVMCYEEVASTADGEEDSDIGEDINIDVQRKINIKLPPHMRCPCHLLNLIATADVHKITNVIFKKLKKRVDSKFQIIWNKQARSSLSSDFIKEKLDVLFVLHNATRWNSYYDAINCIHHLIETKNNELWEVFQHFKVQPLTKQEEDFVAEFVRIMEPFTQALDVLQNEEKMNIGCVLPTIKLLKTTMLKFLDDETITHCRPLVFAVLGGIDKRFSHMMSNNKLKIAAISDLYFKLIWVEEDSVNEYISLLKGVVRKVRSNHNE